MAAQRPLGMDVHQVHDAAAGFLQRRGGGLGQEQRDLEIGAHEVVPVPLSDLAHRRGEERGSIVDQHVQPPEARQRVLHQLGQPGDVEQVGLHQRHRIGARRVQFGLQGLGRLFRGAVMQHHVGAGRVQGADNGRPDALRAAGDESNFLVEWKGHDRITIGQFYRIARSFPPILFVPTMNVQGPSTAPDLPPPSPEARAHGARVAEAIRAAIAQAGGALSFSRYMYMALYAPGLGYYSAGARKLGADGDFITAPELSPLFGQTLARAVQGLFEGVGLPRNILEVGAGSGALAASMLEELARLDALPDQYFILELSADLRQRERDTLAARVPDLVERVVWLNQLP